MSRVANPDRAPHPKHGGLFSMTARFPKEVFAQLHAIALRDERSLNFVVNELVQAALSSTAETTTAEDE